MLKESQRMQLSKADGLYDIQRLLWHKLGLDPAAQSAGDLQQQELNTCLAAARAICLQQVS